MDFLQTQFMSHAYDALLCFASIHQRVYRGQRGKRHHGRTFKQIEFACIDLETLKSSTPGYKILVRGKRSRRGRF